MVPALLLSLNLTMGAPPEPLSSEAPRTELHQDALARYGVAIWNARRDRLLTAVKGFEDAARQDPTATAPKKELARLYAQLGRDREAIRVARQVLEADPQDADTAHLLARLLFEAGEVNEAAAAARLAAESRRLNDRPDKRLAILRDLATLADRAGDPDTAEQALRTAMRLLTEHRQVVLASGLYSPREIDSELAETYERLGKLFVKRAKYDTADEAFRAAHALYLDPDRANDPHSAARLDWNLSSVAAARNDPTAAVTYLERFLRLQPQAVEPYERYVSQMRLAGRSELITGKLRALADRDPDNLHLLVVLAAELARHPMTRGDAEFTFGRIAEATNDKSIMRVMVRSRVENAQARRILDDLDAADTATRDDKLGPMRQAFAAGKFRVIGDILRDDAAGSALLGRAAVADLRVGQRHNPATWHLLGWLATRHGQLEVAVHQYREAIRNAPPDTETDAYVGLIETLRRLRRPADIAAVCREGLLTARGVPPVYFNFHLSLALAELGDPEGAIAAADKAILQAGDAARLDAQIRKVWVLDTLGRDEEALALGKKLLDEFSALSERLRIRYVLASVYHSAKKYAEWELELRILLDADPDHAAACNSLGYHFADQNRNLDEAELLIRHALAVDRMERHRAGDPERESASYLDSLGWVLFRKGKLADARRTIERAAAMPDGAASGDIWDHLGDVCFRSGDKPAARAAWDKALAAYAADARAKRQGRPDAVRRKLEQTR